MLPLTTMTPPTSLPSMAALIREGRIVFGCARLHHLRTAAERERLLRTALDSGVRTFDVAPSYGNGLNERALGDALRRAGGVSFVATKAGLPAWMYPVTAWPFFPLFRAVDVLSGTNRRAYRRRDFSPANLRRSLDASLARLRVERVDTYFLHEPLRPFSAGEWSDVGETMTRLRELGKVKEWGVAGPADAYRVSQLSVSDGLVIQQPASELRTVVPTFVRRRVAYGIFSAFRASAAAGENFEAFVARVAADNADTSFVVSTLDVRRLAHWVEVGR